MSRLEVKPGAVPTCQQPFPLFAYDQLRLEYHEDLEVHEGKAEWLKPGVASPWASPSFVVDQAGKGGNYRFSRADQAGRCGKSPLLPSPVGVP